MTLEEIRKENQRLKDAYDTAKARYEYGYISRELFDDIRKDIRKQFDFLSKKMLTMI